MIKKIQKSEEEWKKILTSEQYKIMREKGTEVPFSCVLENRTKGTYYCAACDLPLFKSEKKFESGTGWPSFFEPVSKENIIEQRDDSLGMRRTEVLCARCDSHLGHVFLDGPPPTDKRYCINSIALKFNADDSETEAAYFGGGCFWCLEAVFSKVLGVKSVKPGYAGGNVSNPTYDEVCNGDTGHAEVVKVDFMPKIINYEILLDIFFSVHDPTTSNRQGGDMGSQYRSIILYTNAKQQLSAVKVIGELKEKNLFKNPIVTEVVPFEKFYPAEEYHKNYFAKNPDKIYCQAVISPKLAKFRERFSKYLQS